MVCQGNLREALKQFEDACAVLAVLQLQGWYKLGGFRMYLMESTSSRENGIDLKRSFVRSDGPFVWAQVMRTCVAPIACCKAGSTFCAAA